MKAFMEWLHDDDRESYKNLMEKDSVPLTWFSERGLPAVVACTCCGSTMALPSAHIDDEGCCFCPSCAESFS